MVSDDQDPCKGTTAKGDQCGQPAQDDGYCYLHGPDEDDADDEAESEADDEPETVTVMSTKEGYVCPGVHFDSTDEFKEFELTTPVKQALERGDLKQV
jgi:hypothetical protein